MKKSISIYNKDIKYRADIDGLRTIAVLAVVFHHYGIRGFSGGYIGVDIFFVISGYLISSIILTELDHGNFSISTFYQRRIRRIMPALFLVIIASFGLAFSLMLNHELEFFSRSAIAASLSVSNIFFWKSCGYFDGGADENPLLHTWSLSVEEQFYILFPILLIILKKTLWQHKTKILVVIFFASLCASVFITKEKPTAGFYLPITRAHELIVGALIFLSPFSFFGRKYISQIASAIGITAIFIAIIFFSKKTNFPGYAALLPILATALIIYSGKSYNFITSTLSTKGIVFIGKMSYSLYLWHWPLMVFAKYYLMRELENLDIFILFSLTLAISFLSYKYIEIPFRNGIKSSTKRRDFLYFTLFLSILIAANYVVIANKGFPSLHPDFIVNADNDLIEQQKSGKCFLSNTRDKNTPIPAATECQIIVAKSSNAKNYFLWGDSYANHYIGAISDYNKAIDINFYSITQSSCAPLPDIEEPLCEEYNNKINEYFKTNNIDTVVISANWFVYSRDPYFLTKLKKTTSHLKSLGYNIIVIGISPVYHSRVPSIYARALKYGDSNIKEYKIEFDDALNRDIMETVKDDAFYFSPYEMWCVKDICTFKDDISLFHFDHGHLTRHGAKLIIDKLFLALKLITPSPAPQTSPSGSN